MRKSFSALMVALTILTVSCSKQDVETTISNPDQVFEIKAMLDQAAIDHRTPELALSITEIEQALRGEHPLAIEAQRDDCTDWCFKRTLQGGKGWSEFRVNILTLVGQILPVYGTEVAQNDPRDMGGNDNLVNSDDLLVALASFGNEFSTVPLLSIETIGGEVSGSGELATFEGALVFEGDTLTPISLFEGSNCFIQDYDPSADFGDECLDQSMLTFVTEIGTVKYFHIN